MEQRQSSQPMVLEQLDRHIQRNKSRHWSYIFHKCEVKVTKSCPALWNRMDCKLPGSSVHRIFQARILEWVAISFLRGSSWPRDTLHLSHRQADLYHWATREAQEYFRTAKIIYHKHDVCLLQPLGAPKDSQLRHSVPPITAFISHGFLCVSKILMISPWDP